MAVTVEEIAVQGPKLTVERTGVSRLRHYSVQGLDPNGDPFYQAVTAPGIPRIGQADRKFGGVYCSKIDFDHYPRDSRTGVLVRAVFSSPEAGNLTGIAVKVSIRTANGQKMIVRWPSTTPGKLGDPIAIAYNADGRAFPARIDPKTVGKNAARTLYNQVQIPVLSPGTLLEFERIEKKSSLKTSYDFRRKVNNATWQGAEKGTWFCRSIDCDSLNGLRYFTVRYVFEHDPRGEWNERLELFRDRDTGITPPDIIANIAKGNNNGYVRFKPYEEADFNALKLPSVL